MSRGLTGTGAFRPLFSGLGGSSPPPPSLKAFPSAFQPPPSSRQATRMRSRVTWSFTLLELKGQHYETLFKIQTRNLLYLHFWLLEFLAVYLFLLASFFLTCNFVTFPVFSSVTDYYHSLKLKMSCNAIRLLGLSVHCNVQTPQGAKKRSSATMHCKEPIPKIRNNYYQKRNCAATTVPCNFHIHVSVSDLYIPTIDLPILLQEICGPILGIYKSLTDT